MANKYLLLILTALISLNGCRSFERKISRDIYVNLIDYRFTPAYPTQRGVPMSDLGAWHGIALPSEMDTIVGVTGPYLLGEFCWAGISMNMFSLANDENPLNYQYYSAKAFPGLFVIEAAAEDCHIISNTIFLSERSYISKVTVKNTSMESLDIMPQWKGRIFNPFVVDLDSNIVSVKTEKGLISVSFKDSNKFGFVLLDDTTYTAVSKQPFKIQPGSEICFASIVTYMPYGELLENESQKIIETLNDPDAVFTENEFRWNDYLKSVIRNDIRGFDHIPVKAVQTMMTNWKSPAGDLKHQGLVPSMAVSYFYGFWAWDSWKHAVALVNIDPGLAKDQIRTMFDYQDDFGMVADCVFPEPEDNNWRNTKPPLAVWAVYEIYKTTGDLDFVKEMLPKLIAYHNWWYEYRDFNKNGLCEWGSSDGTLIAAKWESGMDNAVRFDDAEMIEYLPYAYSINQESVDLNAYLYYEKTLLSRLLRNVGDTENAQMYEKEASVLKDLINEIFFNEDEDFYFDVDADTHEHIRVAGPEGWTPLWCGAATDDIADRAAQVMLDKNRFNTFIPFPTLDASHPGFEYNGYWRGSIWLDQVYFGVSALRKYGMDKEADELTFQVFENLAGLRGSLPVYENYDAHTGEPLRAPNFSWSAAHLLILYNELYTN